MLLSRGRGHWWFAVLLGLALTGCGTRMTKAPVEDRTPTATQAAAAAPEAKLPPGAENAGKPGYYTVKRGER